MFTQSKTQSTNFDTDYGDRLYQEFGPPNDGNGRSIPAGGSQQYRHLTLCGTPAARARVIAALELLHSDQYAAGLLQQFVKRIDCVQMSDRLSRQSYGYPFQAVDPRWPVRVLANFIFKGAFYNSGWRDETHGQQVQIELQKLDVRLLKSAPQSHQSQSSHQTAIDVPKRYRQKLNAALEVVARCMDFQEFQDRFESIIYDPNQRTFRQARSCPAFTHCKSDRRSIMYLNDLFFGSDNPASLAFVLMHEYYHARLWDNQQTVGDLAEEKACDKFSQDRLNQAGFTHDYISGYSPELAA